MSTPRLRKRAPSAQAKGIGYIDGYDLRFHKRSTDGSGKADAFRTGRVGDRVWGVVFELSDADFQALDKAEGAGQGYQRVSLDVSTPRGCLIPGASVVPACAYLATACAIDTSVQPYTWYKRYVVAGAREHPLPDDYVAKLESVVAVEDPDPKRAAKHAVP
jgi:hypothetical protein